MSEDRTTQIDSVQAKSNDSALVDRTQQLIDEVNKLMGAGSSSTASKTVDATKTPVSPTATTPQPTAEINNLDSDNSTSTLQSFISDLSTGEAAPDTVAEVETAEVEVEHQQPAENAAAQAVQVEAALTSEAPAPVENTVEPPVVDEEVAPPAVDTEAPGSESSTFDIAALRSLFDDEPAAEEVAVDETPMPEAEATSTMEATSQVDTAEPSELPTSVSVLENDIAETVDSEALTLPEVFATTEATGMSESAPSAPVAESAPASELASASESVSVSEPETEVQPEATSAEPEVAADENAAPLDMTQKYLDELRSAFDDESSEETKEEPLQSIESTSVVEAAESQPVVAEEPTPTVEEPEAVEPEVFAEPETAAEPESSTDDSAAASVESWLASRFGKTEESEDQEEDSEGQESGSAIVSESTELESTESETASEVVTDEKTAGNPTSAESSQSEEAKANERAAFESLSDDQAVGLEAAINRKLNRLEKRIGGMFASLSDQLNQIAHGVGVEGIRIAEVTAVFDEEDAQDSAVEPGVVSDSDDGGGSENIAALKKELTSKLREAEMELSINRAKLSQQRASIEQMQADLERREAALEAKLEHAKKNGGGAAVESSGEKKRGLMDRWKRHLGE